jgi:hypothetical protein
MFPYKLNVWKSCEKVSSSEIRKRLHRSKTLDIKAYLGNKHNIIPYNLKGNPFVSIKRTTKEAKLQDVQFKLLHNIYPTNSNLFKWKIRDSDKCLKCNVKDDLRHCLFECQRAKDSFDNLVQYLKENNITLTAFSYEEILFGTNSTWEIVHQHFKHSICIDEILLIMKKRLLNTLDTKQEIKIPDIKKLVNDQIAIGQSTNNRNKRDKKWKVFIQEK